MRVDVVSLRQVDVTLGASVPGPAADAFRQAVDANEDGEVSGEEYAVYVSAVELLAFSPGANPVEAYLVVWEKENATGASPFTPAGRFNMGTLALGQSVGMRPDVAIDGQPGQGRVTYLTLPGLAGPVHSNQSVAASVTMRFTWAGFSSFEPHVLRVAGPALVDIIVRLPGGTLAQDVSGLASPVTRQGGTLVEGTTSTGPMTITIAPRPTTFTAVGLAVTVIVGVGAVAGYGALVVSRQHIPRGATTEAPAKPK